MTNESKNDQASGQAAAQPRVMQALADLYALVSRSAPVPDSEYHIVTAAAAALGFRDAGKSEALDQQAVRDAEIKRHIELVKAYGDHLYCKARAESPVDQRSWSKSAESVLTNIVASARALKSTNGGAA